METWLYSRFLLFPTAVFIFHVVKSSLSFFSSRLPLLLIGLSGFDLTEPALSPPSTSVSSDFMYVICKFFVKIYYTHFTLSCRGPGGTGPLPGGLTNCWLGYLIHKNRLRYDIGLMCLVVR